MLDDSASDASDMLDDSASDASDMIDDSASDASDMIDDSASDASDMLDDSASDVAVAATGVNTPRASGTPVTETPRSTEAPRLRHVVLDPEGFELSPDSGRRGHASGASSDTRTPLVSVLRHDDVDPAPVAVASVDAHVTLDGVPFGADEELRAIACKVVEVCSTVALDARDPVACCARVTSTLLQQGASAAQDVEDEGGDEAACTLAHRTAIEEENIPSHINCVLQEQNAFAPVAQVLVRSVRSLGWCTVNSDVPLNIALRALFVEFGAVYDYPTRALRAGHTATEYNGALRTARTAHAAAMRKRGLHPTGNPIEDVVSVNGVSVVVAEQDPSTWAEGFARAREPVSIKKRMTRTITFYDRSDADVQLALDAMGVPLSAAQVLGVYVGCAVPSAEDYYNMLIQPRAPPRSASKRGASRTLSDSKGKRRRGT